MNTEAISSAAAARPIGMWLSTSPRAFGLSIHALLMGVTTAPGPTAFAGMPCAAEAEARAQLRTRLKAAVKAQSVPPELQVRIREQIRSSRSNRWFAAGWFATGGPRWAVALAASVVICGGVWLNYSRERMPALSDRPGQNAYIQKVSATLATVLKVGLGDHIHCSIFRKYPPNPPAVEKMEADLGPSYQGLLPVVRSAVPDGYRVIMAHQCSYAGRKFIHLTFEKGGAFFRS